MFELLIYEKEAPLAFITINRPQAMNALSNALVEELDRALDRTEGDHEIRALIITGAGEKAFMAGADIGELKDRDFLLARQQTRRRQQVFNRIAEMNIPVIAAVNG
ncbi:MAG TPA: enoyl-CoA hydratase-related protein, partial [Clostridia bacterium]|nr:enoyl-CoA hydratase-related protein [Clostridia bacterium]